MGQNVQLQRQVSEDPYLSMKTYGAAHLQENINNLREGNRRAQAAANKTQQMMAMNPERFQGINVTTDSKGKMSGDVNAFLEAMSARREDMNNLTQQGYNKSSTTIDMDRTKELTQFAVDEQARLMQGTPEEQAARQATANNITNTASSPFPPEWYKEQKAKGLTDEQIKAVMQSSKPEPSTPPAKDTSKVLDTEAIDSLVEQERKRLTENNDPNYSMEQKNADLDAYRAKLTKEKLEKEKENIAPVATPATTTPASTRTSETRKVGGGEQKSYSEQMSVGGGQATVDIDPVMVAKQQAQANIIDEMPYKQSYLNMMSMQEAANNIASGNAMAPNLAQNMAAQRASFVKDVMDKYGVAVDSTVESGGKSKITGTAGTLSYRKGVNEGNQFNISNNSTNSTKFPGGGGTMDNTPLNVGSPNAGGFSLQPSGNGDGYYKTKTQRKVYISADLKTRVNEFIANNKPKPVLRDGKKYYTISDEGLGLRNVVFEMLGNGELAAAHLNSNSETHSETAQSGYLGDFSKVSTKENQVISPNQGS